MGMPVSIEELSEIDKNAGVIINGVDNANLMSVDSTEPLKSEPEENLAKDGEDTVVIEEDKDETADKTLDDKEDAEETEKDKEEEKEEEESNSEILPEDSKNVQKRINKLTKKMRMAERERDNEKTEKAELRKKLEELESKIAAMSSEVMDSNKPKKEDFEDEDDYIEALTEWKIDKKLAESKKPEKENVKSDEINKEQEALKETYYGIDDAIDNGRKKYKDFDKLVLDENLVISPEVTQIVLDTDTPEDIMYYLASNPEKSKIISNLDPVRAAKEIGKIEVKLEKLETEKQLRSKKKYSNAPSPITPVRTDGVTEKDPNKMSLKEYRAWRQKNQK